MDRLFNPFKDIGETVGGWVLYVWNHPSSAVRDLATVLFFLPWVIGIVVLIDAVI